jgi:hypothetical protein
MAKKKKDERSNNGWQNTTQKSIDWTKQTKNKAGN